MKTRTRLLSSLLLAGALFATNAMTVSAADQQGSVRMYVPSGDNAEIQFRDGADAFFKFENVIPGDTLTQYIEMNNQRSETISVFINAADPYDNSDVLEKIGLTITNTDTGGVVFRGNLSGRPTTVYSGDMYRDPVTQPNGIDMGSIAAGATLRIKAVITVPVTLDNDYADIVSRIVWQVRAKMPTPPPPYPSISTSRDPARPGVPDTDPDRRYTTINDGDVPLSGELFTIPDGNVPLADLPKTGGSGLRELGAASAILIAAAVVVAARKTVDGQ